MKKLFFFFFITSFSFCACNQLQKKEDSTSETKKKKPILDEDDEEPITRKKKSLPTLETNTNGKVLNEIIVHESGLQISRAYLSYESGALISEKNAVPLATPVILHLVVEKGWTVKDGKVSLGASERIESDGGEKVVDVEDVFANNSEVDKVNASDIQLKAGITKTRSGIDHFIVTYRLWDKNGDGEVKGSYKLYITPAKDETE